VVPDPTPPMNTFHAALPALCLLGAVYFIFRS
jgi:hypothetical protein